MEQVIEFIAAIYNEQEEIIDLLRHVSPYVDRIILADDGSTDNTLEQIMADFHSDVPLVYDIIEHTGLPETVKNHALSYVNDGSWVIMLDADERFAPGVLEKIIEFCKTTKATDYVYCRQVEVIDGKAVREFQKAKVFKKESISFPLENIHADDQFRGQGEYRGDWLVIHRKSSGKQRLREKEYVQTYKKLLDEGKIDVGRYNWLLALHHFERG